MEGERRMEEADAGAFESEQITLERAQVFLEREQVFSKARRSPPSARCSPPKESGAESAVQPVFSGRQDAPEIKCGKKVEKTR